MHIWLCCLHFSIGIISQSIGINCFADDVFFVWVLDVMNLAT